MIVHIVLLRPRPDLPDRERRDLLDGLAAAAAQISSVRRFRVGRRVRHGLPGYEQAMLETYDYAAVVEFDDREGLLAYLTHPAHDHIGQHFTTSSEAALAYDYEMVEATAAPRLASPDPARGD